MFANLGVWTNSNFTVICGLNFHLTSLWYTLWTCFTEFCEIIYIQGEHTEA